MENWYFVVGFGVAAVAALTFFYVGRKMERRGAPGGRACAPGGADPRVGEARQGSEGVPP